VKKTARELQHDIEVHPADAPRYFAKLPGSETMYRKLADKLMTYYRENASA